MAVVEKKIKERYRCANKQQQARMKEELLRLVIDVCNESSAISVKADE